MGEAPNAFGSFSCNLRFVVKDVDEEGVPDKEGYEDEYQVEEVNLTAADFILPSLIQDFRGAWTSLGEQEAFETKEQFLLALPTMKDATDMLVTKLGMAACGGTQGLQRVQRSTTCFLVVRQSMELQCW